MRSLVPTALIILFGAELGDADMAIISNLTPEDVYYGRGQAILE